MNLYGSKIKTAIIKTAKRINAVRSFYSTCPKEFQEYNKTRLKLNSDSFCNAPFTNLYFGFGGKVTSCCYNRTHVLGSYPQNNISEIWNGKKLWELQNRLQNYDLDSGCEPCKKLIEEKAYDSILAKSFDEIKASKRFPVSMEFELDNTCNLECQMCSGEFSSKILIEREKQTIKKSPYDQAFTEQLKHFIPHLKKAKFLGGEPFLIKIYYQIWESIITLNKNCDIVIQTNATILNDKIKQILEKGKFHFSISIDSLNKDPYEGIRKNASFELVMQNINYFQQYSKIKNTFFGFAICPMQQNWKEIPEIINYCNKSNIQITFNRVWHPPQCALWNLPSEKLKEIKNYYSDITLPNKSKQEYNNKLQFTDLCKQIELWLNEAIVREKNYKSLDSLSAKNLEIKLSDNIRNYLSSIHMDSDENINALNKLFPSFRKASDYKYLLIKIHEIPIEILCRELSNNSTERLKEQAKQLLSEKK